MKHVHLVLMLLAAQASAQGSDLANYNRALSAYNSNNFEEAARLFFDLSNITSDNELRYKAEYYLASSFQRQKLPFTAFMYFNPIVQAGPAHPFHNKAVEAFVALQEQLRDDFLIPKILNNNYDKFADTWATLPLEVLARINYMVGRISYQSGKFDDAKQFLEALPDTSQFYAKAQYLRAITLADPRFAASDENDRRAHTEQAIDILENILKIRTRQLDFAETQQLTLLALGRTNYNVGLFAKSVESYEKIPRFSKFWDQALFENGFARFQNDDLGGGLGSLQGLYAPQFAGAFQPESRILTATIYYFSCLYEESKSALLEFEKIYLPMAEQLKIELESPNQEPTFYLGLLESDRVPGAVRNWVTSNERMLGLLKMRREIEFEKKRIGESQSWRAAKLSDELTKFLDENSAVIEKAAGTTARNRLMDAQKTIRGFSDQAEIIRFEIAKAEKELAESGTSVAANLQGQKLFRPRSPAENWNYWTFEGEFWRDEIGYYQYTLKKGCPAVERSSPAQNSGAP
jgi:hypothetical protein